MPSRLRIALVCLAVAFAAQAPVQAADRAPPSARSFIDSIGIGAHLSSTRSAYGDLPLVGAAISYLGVRHVRDSLAGLTVADGWVGDLDETRLVRLGVPGLMGDAVISNLDRSTDTLKIMATRLDMVEGPNEPDYYPKPYAGLTGVPGAAAMVRDLYRLIHQTPGLQGVKVANFSMGKASLIPTAGDQSGFVDLANLHPYSHHGDAPHLFLPDALEHIDNARGRPVVLSETGFATDSPWGPRGARKGANHSMVSEIVAAKYTLDLLLDAYKAHVYRTYIYELFDEKSDFLNNNAEFHFGLYRADRHPKPAAFALHNLTTILADGDAATPPVAAPLSWKAWQSQTGPAMDLARYHLLLQKSNGAQDLIVWAEGPLWHSHDLKALPPVTPNKVVLHLSRPYRSVKVYDPIIGTAPILDAPGGQFLRLSLTDHPLIIEVAD